MLTLFILNIYLEINLKLYHISIMRRYEYFKHLLMDDMHNIVDPICSMPWLLMSWRREAPGHQQPWHWPSSLRLIWEMGKFYYHYHYLGITRQGPGTLASTSAEQENRQFAILRPRQNAEHFADDIFNHIFLKENFWFSTNSSLKFFRKGPINSSSALVQIMTWRWPGDKPLTEPMMVSLLMHICVTRPQWINVMSVMHFLKHWNVWY